MDATIKNIRTLGIEEDSLDLADLCQRTLDSVIDVYSAANVPLPTRRYWAVGAPAEDCAQVVVSFNQLYLGLPGDQASDAQRCGAPRSAVLNVYITRDYPIGENAEPINTERLIRASEWVAVDSWLLMKSIKAFDVTALGTQGPGVIATIVPLAPSGALQTTVLNLTVAVI